MSCGVFNFETKGKAEIAGKIEYQPNAGYHVFNFETVCALAPNQIHGLQDAQAHREE